MLVARQSLAQVVDGAAARSVGGVAGPTAVTGAMPRRALWVSPAIAALMLAVTLYMGDRYGLGLRDPDGVVGGRLVLVLGLVLAFWAIDVVPRGWRESRAAGRPLAECVLEAIRERWTWRRAGIVLGSIIAFYITYLCYRNVKAYIPLVHPTIVDPELLELERSLFFGQDPATILHEIFGRGISAHLLSSVYLLFLTFVPIAIGASLVWSNDMSSGMWWVAALSLNWVLGAASYYLLPSMGPAYAAPHLFSGLPDTGAETLQQTLLVDREAFLKSPVASGELQSIAAFASLHVSIVLTGAILAQLLRAPRTIRVGLWVFFALTTLATVYLGWHYVIDDLGGVVIAVLAVWLGGRLTGWRIERHVSARAT